MNKGVQKFIDDMASAGFPAKAESEVVTFQIVPVDGAHAGRSVDTGVSAGELDSWPQSPPHWVHSPPGSRCPRQTARHRRNRGGSCTAETCPTGETPHLQ